MLSLQSGLKYRQKIEQKLSLAARQPTGDLCDIDPIEEQVFQDKTPAEVAEEARQFAETSNDGKKKSKNKKRKKTTSNARNGNDMLKDIVDGSDTD